MVSLCNLFSSTNAEAHVNFHSECTTLNPYNEASRFCESWNNSVMPESNNTIYTAYQRIMLNVGLIHYNWWCFSCTFSVTRRHWSTFFRNSMQKLVDPSLTLSQCTLAGPMYTGMPLECHWLTQCTLGHHWATQQILARYTGTPLEKLSWKSPHWNAIGETLTFAAYTGTPLEGLWQPTHAPTHIVKHAELHLCQFEMTRWRDTGKQVDRSLYIQSLLGVYCPAVDTSSALNTCEYFNVTLCMPLIWAPL